MTVWMFLAMQIGVALIVALLVWKGSDWQQRWSGRNKK